MEQDTQCPPRASVQVHRPANPWAYMDTCTHTKKLSEDHKAGM